MLDAGKSFETALSVARECVFQKGKRGNRVGDLLLIRIRHGSVHRIPQRSVLWGVRFSSSPILSSATMASLHTSRKNSMHFLKISNRAEFTSSVLLSNYTWGSLATFWHRRLLRPENFRAVYGVDTRALTKHICYEGPLPGRITI